MKRRPGKGKTLAPASIEAAPRAAGESPCPIVGIGASAGGLRAFRDLLEHLPADTRASYVLVTHLDPHHESAMPSILAKSTSMGVEEAKNGTTLEPDHVYVIGPNTIMSVAGGTLRIEPRTPSRKLECIDHFFLSLAKDYRDRAVGVLLSGTASDGTLGLGAIKAEGGITFAQDGSAEFQDMPQNAIAAGHVDFVLPPKAIALEIARLVRHPYVARRRPAATAEAPAAEGGRESPLGKILRFLHRATRIDFGGYKRATLERRVARRMAVRKTSKHDEYLRYLEDHPEEAAVLRDDLLITVTSFFRDPEAFEALKTKVFPALIEGRSPQDAIRIWVPGCASGEEAYSIAIALVELQDERKTSFPVQAFATDVSEAAIEKARAGSYESGIAADVSPERLRRFFVKSQRGGFQVAKSLRDLFVFARHDLTRDPPFSGVDLLCCRNVLIYLGTALQKRAISLFHYALRPKAFLLLGSSESVDQYADLFKPVDKRWRIYAKVPAIGLPRFELGAARLQEHLQFAKREPPPEFQVQQEADRALLARYVPAGVVVDEEGRVVEVRGETGPYLRPAPGKPSFSLQKMARAELAIDLESALLEARRTGAAVRRDLVRLKSEGRLREVRIEVLPLRTPPASLRHFAVLFEEAPAPETPPPAAGKGRQKKRRVEASQADPSEVARLREELRQSLEHRQAVVETLEATNEELRSANEEILSSNEELQSTNEELETSKEELQSANEELTTLNEELRSRNAELAILSGDLANVLSSAQLPIAILDRGLRLRRMTPAAEKLLNVRPSDVGRRITDFRPNVSVPDLEGKVLAVMESLTPTEEEVKDAAGRWHSLCVRPYRSVDDKIEGAVLVFVDIEAQKRAFAEVEEARDFSRAIVETVRDPLIVLDPGLRVEMASASFYAMFGVSKEETEGRLIYDLGNRQWDVPWLRQLLEEVLPKERGFHDFEVDHDFERIGRRTMLLHGRQLRGRPGAPPRILLAVEDISDRESRRRDRFLAGATERLTASLESSRVLAAFAEASVPDLADACLVVMIDERGTISVAAAAPADLASDIGEDIPPSEKDAGVFRVIRTGESRLWRDLSPSGLAALVQLPGALRILREKGARSAMVVPIRVRGTSLGAALFFRDGSKGPYGRQDLEWAEEYARRAGLAIENARLYAETREAVRAREQFLGIASHELKTPLTALDLQLKLLMEGRYPDPCPLGLLRKTFATLTRQRERLSTLVDRLLDLSRVEGAKLDFEDARVDLADVLREVVGRFRESVAGSGSKIDLEVQGPVAGRFDRLRVDQVATNLISNAVKYGEANPIDVRLDAHDGLARLSVRDRGIGIAPADRARIFGRFERTFQARRYGGLGLGLYISRQIVEHYGGSIGVESEPGNGSTFTVELPLPGAEAGRPAGAAGIEGSR